MEKMRISPHDPSGVQMISLATAIPAHKFDKENEVQRWETLFPDNSKLISDLMAGITKNSGVETQYSANPLSWYAEKHGYVDRNQSFVDASVELLADAGRRCLSKANAAAGDVDTILLVCNWGLSPGIDVRLIKRLGLRSDIKRIPVFGLGCAGGVQGIARAADLAKSDPGSLVLLLVVELSSSLLRHNDASKINLLSTALCGDGAAAALITCQSGGVQVRGAQEHTWHDEINLMGMKIKDDGPMLIMPQTMPDFLKAELLPLATSFLAKHGMTIGDMRHLAFHPGGKEVLKLYKDVFELDDAELDDEWRVLRDYGNMSGVTIFFVLERRLALCERGPMLLTALGPGLTLALALLEVH